MSPRRRGVVATLMGARRRVGVGLLAGALLVWWGGGALGFDWVPLLAGLGYLLAAWGGGPKEGPWGPACVLVGWGAAVVAVREGWVEQPEAPMFLVGVGAGLVAAALLRERGHQIGIGGTGAAVLVAGLAYLFVDDVEALAEPTTYAVAIAAYGVLNLLEVKVGRR
jgi:hypothetical protein